MATNICCICYGANGAATIRNLVAMQLAAPVPEQTHSVDELPLLQTIQPHVKLTHSLV